MDTHTADVLIVGAGPAGCAAAYDLTHKGLRVHLLDKADFPRVKPCAGGLTMKTLNALRYPVTPVIQRWCATMVAGLFCEKQTAMTVRAEFDAFCLDQCLAAGVTFQRISPILDVRHANKDWVVITRDARYRGTYLIGADGANSRVRQLLYPNHPVRFGAAVETCLPVPDPEAFEMEMDFGYVDKGYAWIFPKRDHLNVGLYALYPVKGLKSRLREFCGERLKRSLGQSVVGHRIPHHGFTFTHGADTVFLTGDAAGLIDPLLGEGIYNAIRSGQIAAAAIINMAAGKPNRYPRKILEIHRDIESYWLGTRAFYRYPRMGYRHLMFPPVRYCLMKGYALGWIIRRIKHRFPLLPFYRIRRF